MSGTPHGDADETENVGGRSGPSLAGRVIGGFRLLRELGSGGQGFVWEAEDLKLRRRVALKIIPRAAAFSRTARLRFEREAEVTARLEHPGICSVYDVGEDDGIPYIAMQLVEGEALDRRITSALAGSDTTHISLESSDDGAAPVGSDPAASSRDSSSPGNRAEIHAVCKLIESAALALHAAHEEGLIHRDIKPGNMMVAPEGHAVLLDFGLARDELTDGATLTETGDFMGTPAYMSPEQLLAHRVKLDRRTDVYSLGVTLYECLTLRRPYEVPSREALYEAINRKDPPRPRSRNPAISRDLEVVILTAMEKDRDRRYQTAASFAEDLRRVVAQEPILARPVGPLVRAIRWVQRNPARAALVALVVIVSLAVTGYLGYSVAHEKRREDLLVSELRTLDSDIESGDVGRARASLQRAMELGLPSERGTEYFGRIDTMEEVAAQRARERRIEALEEHRRETANRWRDHHANAPVRIERIPANLSFEALSEDASRAATCDRWQYVRIWNAVSGEELYFLDREGSRGMALDAAGRRLILARGDEAIEIWNVKGVPEMTWSVPTEVTIEKMWFAPDERAVAVRNDGSVLLLDLIRSEVTRLTPAKPLDRVEEVATSQDGLIVAARGNPGGTIVWDLAARRERPRHAATAHAMALNDSGTLLGLVSLERIAVFDTKTAELVGSRPSRFDTSTSLFASALAFTPGDEVLVGYREGWFDLWDPSDKIHRGWAAEDPFPSAPEPCPPAPDSRFFGGEDDMVLSFEFIEEDVFLVKRSKVRTDCYQYWPRESGRKRLRLLASSEDGDRLPRRTRSTNGYFLEHSTVERVLGTAGVPLGAVSRYETARSPNGRWLLAWRHDDEAATLLDTTTFSRRTVPLPEGEIVGLGDDGETIATSTRRDAEHVITLHPRGGHSWSETAKTLTTRSFEISYGNGGLSIRPASGETREISGQRFASVAVSPDERRLVATGSNRAIVVDLQTFEVTTDFETSVDVDASSISPSGRWIVSGDHGGENTAIVWDAETGERQQEFRIPGRAKLAGFSHRDEHVWFRAADVLHLVDWRVGTTLLTVDLGSEAIILAGGAVLGDAGESSLRVRQGGVSLPLASHACELRHEDARAWLDDLTRSEGLPKPPPWPAPGEKLRDLAPRVFVKNVRGDLVDVVVEAGARPVRTVEVRVDGKLLGAISGGPEERTFDVGVLLKSGYPKARARLEFTARSNGRRIGSIGPGSRTAVVDVDVPHECIAEWCRKNPEDQEALRELSVRADDEGAEDEAVKAAYRIFDQLGDDPRKLARFAFQTPVVELAISAAERALAQEDYENLALDAWAHLLRDDAPGAVLRHAINRRAEKHRYYRLVADWMDDALSAIEGRGASRKRTGRLGFDREKK